MFFLSRKFIFCIVFLFSGSTFSEVLKSKTEKEKALSFFKKVLSKYQSESIHFKIEKSLFLPSMNETLKEEGDFYIEKQKFRIKIKGQPSYLMIFNGDHLWYQPDLKEKIVFKLKDHPQIHLFFLLFDIKSFFQYFSIQKIIQKNSKIYSFQLKATKHLEEVNHVSLEVGKYIQEIKVVWKDLEQWQKYKFFNPWVKKTFPKNKFQFSEKDFEVISKQSL